MTEEPARPSSDPKGTADEPPVDEPSIPEASSEPVAADVEGETPITSALEKRSPGPDAVSADEEDGGMHDPITGMTAQELHTRMISKMTDEEQKYLLSLTGFSDFLRSTNRLFWTNFLMGLARGVGFVIGMSIIGAVFVSIWNEFLSVSGLGHFISKIIEEINRNAPQ